MDTPRIPLKQAYRDLGKLVRGAHYQNRTVVITEHGRPAAMITPVDDHHTILDIDADILDGDGWREAAVTAWLEAADETGYGFTVVAEPADGDVLAVVERDRWDEETGERLDGGDRYELVAVWPEGLAVEDRGKGAAQVIISARPTPQEATV